MTSRPENNVAAPVQTSLERQQLAIVDPSGHTFWHWVRFDLVAAAAHKAGVQTVVDIGAGSGMLGDWLAEQHPDISYRFEELSPTLDAALVERFGADARHPDGEAITESLVTMLDVIEHIEHPTKFLSTVRGRLDKGASVMVTVPALQWAFSSWDSELGHHRRYSKRSLRAELVAAGFVVSEAGYLFPEMLPLLPIRKLRRAQRHSADFPEMRPWANRIGYAISSSTARLRLRWPAGTSAYAIAHRPDDDS